MKLLIIRFSAMGDVAMTVPVVASLLKQYPELQVDFLSNQAYADLFFGIEGLRFIGVDLNKYSGIWGLFRLFNELKVNKYTHIIDLHDVLRTQVIRNLFRLTGLTIAVIDKGRKEKRALTARYHKKQIQLKSGFERYATPFRSLGYPIDFNFDRLVLPTPSLAVQQLLSDKPMIGIAPFAQHTCKVYPLDQMKQVVAQLSQSYQVYLFSGRGDELKRMTEWTHQFDCIAVAGRLSLLDELVLISHLKAMLSMDSANMHLASLVGTRVISVWGATHYFAGFMPWKQCEKDVIQIDLACRPCSVYGNKACWRGDFACMHQISPASIVAKITQV